MRQMQPGCAAHPTAGQVVDVNTQNKKNGRVRYSDFNRPIEGAAAGCVHGAHVPQGRRVNASILRLESNIVHFDSKSGSSGIK